MLNCSEYKDTIYVTVAYIGLYYGFLYLQSLGKMYLYRQKKRQFALDKKDDKEKAPSYGQFKYGQTTDKLCILLDRTAGNTMEQAIPFLVSLWLNAAFVGSSNAAYFGTIYIIFRAIYPIGFYFGIPFILISTVPGYACVLMLLYQCYSKASLS